MPHGETRDMLAAVGEVEVPSIWLSESGHQIVRLDDRKSAAEGEKAQTFSHLIS